MLRQVFLKIGRRIRFAACTGAHPRTALEASAPELPLLREMKEGRGEEARFWSGFPLPVNRSADLRSGAVKAAVKSPALQNTRTTRNG